MNKRLRINLSEGGMLALSSMKQMFERNWSRIDQAYGHPLDDTVKERMLSAIYDFVNEAQIEQNAPLQSEVIDWLASARQAARKFKDELTSRGALSERDMRIVTVLLQQEMRSLGRQAADLSAIRTMASKLATACGRASAKIKNKGGFNEGDAWRNLIIASTRILGEAGLPTGAPQSRDKKSDDFVAPFVALIIAIQKLLPPDIRRHDRADPLSLAKEINRARKSVRDRLPRSRTGKMSRIAVAGHKAPRRPNVKIPPN